MSIACAIEKFQGITLSQMDGVKLMNRTDWKFWFNKELLSEILEDVAQDYYVLVINQERNLPYATSYYDTSVDEMYVNHHRGKTNRYKIRRRNYVSTNTCFLEVKFKNNKGRTIKLRRESEFDKAQFDLNDEEFIKTNTPYECGQLRRVLNNGFCRIMLVSKQMNERCTIDTEICFENEHNCVTLGDLVIVEVKRDGCSQSKIIEALHKHRIRPSGFSKYCVGRSLIDSALKQNNFKKKHRQINRKINEPIRRLSV